MHQGVKIVQTKLSAVDVKSWALKPWALKFFKTKKKDIPTRLGTSPQSYQNVELAEKKYYGRNKHFRMAGQITGL